MQIATKNGVSIRDRAQIQDVSTQEATNTHIIRSTRSKIRNIMITKDKIDLMIVTTKKKNFKIRKREVCINKHLKSILSRDMMTRIKIDIKTGKINIKSGKGASHQMTVDIKKKVRLPITDPASQIIKRKGTDRILEKIRELKLNFSTTKDSKEIYNPIQKMRKIINQKEMKTSSNMPIEINKSCIEVKISK